jgi:transcriptional regulator with XRE-family HTH domain
MTTLLRPEAIQLRQALSIALKALRIKHGYTINEVSHYLGINKGTYWRYESTRLTTNHMAFDLLYKLHILYAPDDSLLQEVANADHELGYDLTAKYKLCKDSIYWIDTKQTGGPHD